MPTNVRVKNHSTTRIVASSQKNLWVAILGVIIIIFKKLHDEMKIKI